MVDDLKAKKVIFKVQGKVFNNIIIQYIIYYLIKMAILACYRNAVLHPFKHSSYIHNMINNKFYCWTIFFPFIAILIITLI